jgi:hypothetical protein
MPAKKNNIQCDPMPPGRGGWSEWVQPIMMGYMMQCCDCGLVHEMQFMVVEKLGDEDENGDWPAKMIANGRVSFRARRAKTSKR